MDAADRGAFRVSHAGRRAGRWPTATTATVIVCHTMSLVVLIPRRTLLRALLRTFVHRTRQTRRACLHRLPCPPRLPHAACNGTYKRTRDGHPSAWVRAHVRHHAHMQRRPTILGGGYRRNPLEQYCMCAPPFNPASATRAEALPRVRGWCGRRPTLRRQVREGDRVEAGASTARRPS